MGKKKTHQLASESEKTSLEDGNLLGGSVQGDLVALLVEVHAHLGRVLLEALQVRTTASNDMTVQPLGNGNGLVDKAVSLGCKTTKQIFEWGYVRGKKGHSYPLEDHRNSLAQAVLRSTKNDLVALVVLAGHLHNHTGLLVNVIDGCTTRANDVSVLRLLDLHRHLTTSETLQSELCKSNANQLLEDSRNVLGSDSHTGLLSRNNNFVLNSQKSKRLLEPSRRTREEC